MAYYNRNLERLKLKRKKLVWLDHGNCAKAFRYGDKVFKEYFSETEDASRLKPEVFDILRDINDDHFIKLFEIYSDMDLVELLIYMCNKNLYQNKSDSNFFQVDSYIAKYYLDNPINVLEDPIDYVLDNFRELDILFDIFTDNGIQTEDMKRENTAMSSNGIVILDPDCFYISKDSKSTLKVKNKENLLHLLKSICCNSVGYYTNYKELKSKINKKLDDICVVENTDIAYEVQKKLSHVKKPIDYFLK